MTVPAHPRGTRAEQLVALAVAVWIGLFLPDFDQTLHLHRWFLTHSALPVLAVLWLRSSALTAGLALGIAAHLSAEPGHRAALAALDLEPMLEWEMRLGEGTGALTALPLLDAAAALLTDVATLAEIMG